MNMLFTMVFLTVSLSSEAHPFLRRVRDTLEDYLEPLDVDEQILQESNTRIKLDAFAPP
ncbi:uncharacterized protein BJ212DRAFT_1344137 [Suillus subaureus]|uniref:Uncharacterized protein n=1 Tax=Suillus subaureus TaxID=48587 RepID=A0A9P7EDW2_9AGAM|nr:uncharacterized protein BJ212DRAFT_1344137 [Suillus subaureus]KAG1819087.1 hypothetical protein BJ212DRAFT_1344137 [Suillus subaureus]